jgi:hypothetical protein
VKQYKAMEGQLITMNIKLFYLGIRREEIRIDVE